MKAHTQFRHFYLITGSQQNRLACFAKLTKALNSEHVFCYAYPSLSENVSQLDSNLTIMHLDKLPQTLGHTTDAILLDIEQGISANALAIAAGTVKGGGVFALGLSSLAQWLMHPDQDLAKRLPWPLTPEGQVSHFKHYFLKSLFHHSQLEGAFAVSKLNNIQLPYVTVIDANDQTVVSKLPSIEPITQEAFQLTSQQSDLLTAAHNIINTVAPLQSTALLLTAHRGRGKSTLMGMLLAYLNKMGLRTAITAPNRSALSIVQQHYQEVLNACAELPFYAPDELIKSQHDIDWLLIDEAAALPLPILDQLSKRSTNLILSTTNHGYELSGKGFFGRFIPKLSAQKALHAFTLDDPVRWKKDDPLEDFINQLLLLYPSESTLIQNTHPLKSGDSTPVIQAFTGHDWLNHPEMLAPLFGLLVSAHYQTSPNDLRWIMDDPSVTTWFKARQTSVLSVAVVIEEGPLDPALTQEILQGTRRPRGHLLPQSLVAHEGWRDAAAFRYWRITRIATEAAFERQGLGSNLLAQLQTQAVTRAVDFLCVSFSAQYELIQFWIKNGFVVVRLGTSKDTSSGQYSVMMVKGICASALKRQIEWNQRFRDDFQFNLLSHYADLPTQVALSLLQTAKTDRNTVPPIKRKDNILLAIDTQDIFHLQLFIKHHRPLSSVRAAFLRTMYKLAHSNTLDPNQSKHVHLFATAIGRISEHNHPYASKKDYLLQTKKTLKALLDTVKTES